MNKTCLNQDEHSGDSELWPLNKSQMGDTQSKSVKVTDVTGGNIFKKCDDTSELWMLLDWILGYCFKKLKKNI